MIWLSSDNKTEHVEAIEPSRDEIVRLRRMMGTAPVLERICRVRVIRTGQVVDVRLAELIPIPMDPDDVHSN